VPRTPGPIDAASAVPTCMSESSLSSVTAISQKPSFARLVHLVGTALAEVEEVGENPQEQTSGWGFLQHCKSDQRIAKGPFELLERASALRQDLVPRVQARTTAASVTATATATSVTAATTATSATAATTTGAMRCGGAAGS
jgi:hypothetical protein